MSVNEREAALNILEDIFINKSYNNLALQNYLKKNPLESKQKNFITELVNGVLRNCIYLDYIIDYYSTAKKIKPFIRILLRMSAYQILFMDKTPDYAAINEAVKLCRKRGFHNLSGFVNAVLRKVAEKQAVLPDKNANSVKYLSIVYSIPEWIVKMWNVEYGNETCAALCEAMSHRPPVTICVNSKKISAEELKKKLCAEGVDVFETNFENAIKVSNTSDLSQLESYKKGCFHVMDLSAMMAADMLNPMENESILDVCAAPGGKSFYLAYKHKGSITACDIYPHKLELMKREAARLGLNITLVNRDAKVFNPKYANGFDNVLVDVPCSGLGLLRKKPDIKLKRTEEDIYVLAGIQKEILKNSALYVKNGGVLLYSTCTLSKRENKDVVESLLSSGGFYLDDEKEILPQEFGSDGFYMARLIKK